MQAMAPINALYSNHEDLCVTCQHFRHGLHIMLIRKKKRETYWKKYREHLVKVKLERKYYHKDTKLAAEQRKLVNKNYLIIGGKADYCSVDATAHYSYDWAQIVHVSHSDQQVSKIYYLSPRKVHLFGIQNRAVREQIPNGTLSWYSVRLWDWIKAKNTRIMQEDRIKQRYHLILPVFNNLRLLWKYRIKFHGTWTY